MDRLRKRAELLDVALDRVTAVIGYIIFLEILQGFLLGKDYRRVKATLAVLEHYEMLGKSMVTKFADNYRSL